VTAVENSRRLIDQTLAGVRPERTPIFDLLCNRAVIEHFAGRSLDGPDDQETVYRAAGRALDGSRWLPVPKPRGATWTDWMGNLHAHDGWTSWLKRHVLSSEEEWLAWLERTADEFAQLAPPTAKETAAARKKQRALNERLGGTCFIHCCVSTSVEFTLFGCHCGLARFSYLWHDHRELLLRWFDAVQRRELRDIALNADPAVSPFAMLFSDVAYKGNLMFGRQMLAEMGFFDNIARLCNAMHGRGLKVVFHSDGYIMDIIADLVAAGVDGLNPIEKAAGLDVYEIRCRWPDLVIVGGLDVTHLLRSGTPADVRAETRRLIDEVGADGRLLIGSTTELEENVPLANYLAFYDEVMAG